MNLPLAEIYTCLGLSTDKSREDKLIADVKIDSRKIKKNDLYVAIKGVNHDGHNFCAAAVASGATVLVVEKEITDLPGVVQIRVENGCEALGKISQIWRNKFEMPLVAITGSCGKTTVKEMTAAVLREHYLGENRSEYQTDGEIESVLATKGNLNNEYGVPLTLLSLRDNYQAAVVELGANHFNEIAYLCGLANPDIALITNAGNAHLQGFGSIDGVAKAKGEMYTSLNEDAIALINKDDSYYEYWFDLIKNSFPAKRIISWGFDPSADIRATKQANTYLIITPQGEFELSLAVAGEHNIQNALAATAVACAMGIPILTVQKSLKQFNNISGRLQILNNTAADMVVIDDCYNANPESVKAAIDVLMSYDNSYYKVFLMGDMRELGEKETLLHRQIGEYACVKKVDDLLCMGELSQYSLNAFNQGKAKGAGRQIKSFATHQQMIEAIQSLKSNKKVVLVKGSRGMKMEKIVDALMLLNEKETPLCC